MRSREHDLEFRQQSIRMRNWGAGLLLLSALLWGWCAFLLLTGYEVETRAGFTDECAARLFTEDGTANEGLWKGDYCEDERDWPEALLILGLSLPVSLVGTALFTTGQVSRRVSGHFEGMRALDRIADEREKREKRAEA